MARHLKIGHGPRIWASNGGYPFLVAIGSATCVGLAAPQIVASNPNVAFAVAQSAILILPLAIAIRSFRRLSNQRHATRGSLAGTPSLFLSLGTLVGVTLPGFQLLTGLRQSLIQRLGFPLGDVQSELTIAYTLWLIALVACWVGDEASTSVTRRHVQTKPVSRLPDGSLMTFICLVAFGLVGTALAASPDLQAAFSNRGQTKGQGILVLAEYGLPLAASLGLLRSHWGRWWAPLLSIVALYRIVSVTGTRTPLLLVGVVMALLLVRRITERRPRPLYVVAGLAAAYVGAVLSLAVGLWRGAIISGTSQGFTDALWSAAANPLAVTAGGLDTLDGLILSAHVDGRVVGATVFDPLKGITNLIPYQIWPDKPDWLSATVTHYYLAFGGQAGIFLSGPGYVYIIGGPVAIAITFLALGFATSIALDRFSRNSMISLLVVYFFVRFSFGGDAFDVLHVMSLAIAYAVAWTVGTAWNRLMRTSNLTQSLAEDYAGNRLNVERRSSISPPTSAPVVGRP